MSAGTLTGEHPETTTAAGDAPVLVHRADGVVTVTAPVLRCSAG
jgi:hypothetical protein